jgi:membrane-associated phospholipid phosphatase
MESLCDRRLFASDLACDVNSSGLVEPLDVLMVINAINASGAQFPTLTDLNRQLDVNRDGVISPLDPLSIINAINRNPFEIVGSASVDAASDPNSNGVVLQPVIRFNGQTGSFATISAQSKLQSSTTQSEPIDVTSDAQGFFRFEVTLQPGVNEIDFTIRDELGRTLQFQRELRLGDVVTDWNAAALNVVRDWTATSNDPYPDRIVPSQPPMVARNLAMLHAAMFDAANAIDGHYESYAYTTSLQPGASAEAAIAWAAHTIGNALYADADERSVWDASLADSLTRVPAGEARDRGREIGLQAAQAVLAKRSGDLSVPSSPNLESTEPGKWRRTAPDYLPPLLPRWPNVKPFAMQRSDQFRSPPPPTLGSAEYAAAVDEVMRLGSIQSTLRTQEQSEIATFWADGAGTATPPGHWNRIATDVLIGINASLIDRARTIALLNIALADAGIASWDTKYHYSVWRPIDAIRLADQDGNSQTQPDSNWTPFLKTPPFAAYTSGHSTFSAAAAAVLTQLFGDNFAFENTSDSFSGLSQRPLAPGLLIHRSFSSFWSAAREAGQSRIYGGIHFAFDNEAGYQAGTQVGQWAMDTMLRRRG